MVNLEEYIKTIPYDHLKKRVIKKLDKKYSNT